MIIAWSLKHYWIWSELMKHKIFIFSFIALCAIFFPSQILAGNFYTNVVLKPASQDDVLKYLRETKKFAYISPTADSATVVYEMECESQELDSLDNLAMQLSKKFDCSAIGFLNHDDDILIMRVFSRGQKITVYNSNPDYFNGGRIQKPSLPNIDELCRLLSVVNKAQKLDSILRKISYTFESERHMDILRILNLPKYSVASSFNYIEQGIPPLGIDTLLKASFTRESLKEYQANRTLSRRTVLDKNVESPFGRWPLYVAGFLVLLFLVVVIRKKSRRQNAETCVGSVTTSKSPSPLINSEELMQTDIKLSPRIAVKDAKNELSNQNHSRWGEVLRWIAMMPASLLGSIITYMLIWVILRLIFHGSYGETWKEVVSGGLASATFVFCAAFIAPRSKARTAIVFAGIYFFWSAFPLFFAGSMGKDFSLLPALIPNIGSIIMAISIFLFRPWSRASGLLVRAAQESLQSPIADSQLNENSNITEKQIMEITVSITQEDYVKSLLQYHRTKKDKRILDLSYFIFCIVLSLLNILLYISTKNTENIIWIVVIIVFFVSMRYDILSRIILQQGYKRDESKHRENVVYSINEDGIHSKASDCETTRKWSSIKRVLESDEYFMIEILERQAIPIPKRCIRESNQSVERLREVIMSHNIPVESIKS
jgi:hypothetical protein